MKFRVFFLFIVFITVLNINYSHAVSRLTCGRKFKIVSSKTKVLNTLKLNELKDTFSYKVAPIPTNEKYAVNYGLEKFNLKDWKISLSPSSGQSYFCISAKDNVFIFDPVLQDLSLTNKHFVYPEDMIWPETFVSDEECMDIALKFIKNIDINVSEIIFDQTISKSLFFKTKTIYIGRKIDDHLFIGRASDGRVEITSDGVIKFANIGIGKFLKYKKIKKIISIDNAFTSLLSGKGVFCNLSQEHYPGPDLNLGELEKVDIVYHTNGIDKLPDMILKPIYRFVFENDGKGNQPWGFYPASE
jgi:hypothetical protein